MRSKTLQKLPASRQLVLGAAAMAIGLVAALVLALVILEVGLRLTQTPMETPGAVRTHPRRGYELRPNFVGKTLNARLHVNSYGLRDYERPISEGDAAFRVAVFGDSVTMGIGVELEETFPKVLERRLNAPGAHPIQVFNLGVASYNTVAEYLYLAESYARFKPHLVIFEYTAENDTALTIPPGSPRALNTSPVVRWAKDSLRYLNSYNWLAAHYYSYYYRNVFKDLADDELQARTQHDLTYYADDFQGWIEAQEAFRKIAAFCAERHVPVVFAVFGNNLRVSASLETDLWFPIISKVVRALKASRIEHVVVLDEAFRPYSGRESLLQVSAQDHHFSPLAHRLAAETLGAFLLERRLVPAAVPRS